MNWRTAAGYAVALALGVVIGQGTATDPQYPPRYGKLGLPDNCSAYVDASIAGLRSKRYTADETMNGLDRNCGARGALWTK